MCRSWKDSAVFRTASLYAQDRAPPVVVDSVELFEKAIKNQARCASFVVEVDGIIISYCCLTLHLDLILFAQKPGLSLSAFLRVSKRNGWGVRGDTKCLGRERHLCQTRVECSP